MEQSFLQTLPKLELHCHLDGSLRPETVRRLLLEQGVSLAEEQVQKALQVPPDCTSLADYLQCFDLPLRCLQNEKALRQAAFDLLEMAAKENVRYIEVRFAPSAHIAEGLNLRQVLESVLSGLRDGEARHNIRGQLIACAMRHHSHEQNAAMLHIAREYLGQGVCALDLAGDEASSATKEYKELFALARKLEMPFTIHAGECGSVESVREAVELGARRLGHGIALIQDEALLEFCCKKRIGIEMCPTSNFQTKAIHSWKEYPLKAFLEKGLPVTISTDNRTVSGTTLTEDLEKVSSALSLDERQIVQLQRNAVEITFADNDLKHMLLKEIGGG